MNTVRPEHLLRGSRCVFSDWSGFKIPIGNLSMQEVIDVVLRFDRERPQQGPMRSLSAQIGANMVQKVLAVDPNALVGVLEKPTRHSGFYTDPGLLPVVAVLADIPAFHFDDVIYGANPSSET